MMLTRKQKWRKCKSYEILKKYEYFKEEQNSIPISEKLKKNYLKFSEIVKVILIPAREEYINNNLDEKLWYSQDDYVNFKSSYLDDIRKSKYNTL